MLRLQVLSLFCGLMPFADCSEAVHVRDDLTDVERELCAQTAQLEPFVDLLLERHAFFVVRNKTLYDCVSFLILQAFHSD